MPAAARLIVHYVKRPYFSVVAAPFTKPVRSSGPTAASSSSRAFLTAQVSQIGCRVRSRGVSVRSSSRAKDKSWVSRRFEGRFDGDSFV